MAEAFEIRIGYLPAAGRLFYEYAGELMAHLGPLAALAAGAAGRAPDTAAAVDTDEALEALLARPDAAQRLRTLYCGCDVLMSGAQQQLLAQWGVQVLPAPECFYRGLEE